VFAHYTGILIVLVKTSCYLIIIYNNNIIFIPILDIKGKNNVELNKKNHAPLTGSDDIIRNIIINKFWAIK